MSAQPLNAVDNDPIRENGFTVGRQFKTAGSALTLRYSNGHIVLAHATNTARPDESARNGVAHKTIFAIPAKNVSIEDGARTFSFNNGREQIQFNLARSEYSPGNWVAAVTHHRTKANGKGTIVHSARIDVASGVARLQDWSSGKGGVATAYRTIGEIKRDESGKTFSDMRFPQVRMGARLGSNLFTPWI